MYKGLERRLEKLENSMILGLDALSSKFQSVVCNLVNGNIEGGVTKRRTSKLH